MFTTNRTPKATRVAAIVAATALSLTLGAPAATAAENTQTGTGSAVVQAQDVQTQNVVAQKAAKRKSVKSLKRALAKARKAQKAVSKQVQTHTDALTIAQQRAEGPAQAHAPAAAAVDAARSAYAPAKAALDRANYVVTNQNALFDDLYKRMQAVEVGYKPLRDANTAANAKVTELRNAREAIRVQRNTASANQSAAATVAGNMQATEIPAIQDAYNAALQNENVTFQNKEAARIDFANRKAQWENTRKVNGQWQGLRNGTWRFVPNLDDAEALLDRRQAEYNNAKDYRQNVESHLAQLNAKLAAVQADINYWYGVFMALNDQYNAAQGPLDAASAAATATANAMNAYFDQHMKPLYNEADALQKEITAAQKNLPALTAAEKPLADALAQATAALAAVAPAHDAAQAAVTAAATNLNGSKANLASVNKKVKVLKKKLKKAKKKARR